MPTKKGKSLPTKKHGGLVGKKLVVKVGDLVELPTKQQITVKSSKRGWIEYPKNPTTGKRYARRRRWIRRNGDWVKSKPKRVKSIPPLTEDEYHEITKRRSAIGRRSGAKSKSVAG